MSEITNLRVTSVMWKSDSIRVIELRSPDEGPLAPFSAGSHIELHLPTGLVRSYSLINSQDERYRYVVAVARDAASRGGSVFIHDNLRVGDIIHAGVPRNLFKLNEHSPSAVLIGGGIGITPLISMAIRLSELGRNWKLYYAVRTRKEAGFLRDLAIYGDRVRVHSDDEQGGFLDIRSIVHSAPPNTHFYCCGPRPMMKVFGELTRNWPPDCIHVEHFTPIDTAAVAGGFLLQLARLGRTVAVPAGSTILEALANAGIEVPNSCQRGVCGTCETRVLGGTPDHRDSILTPGERAAGNTMMICCSGSLTEHLVLDI